jgi:murein tripeptide amidase MpaA
MGYPTGSPKPILLLDAGIHAREWIAPAVALHVINAVRIWSKYFEYVFLAFQLVNDPKWHSLLREIDVHVIPVMNPDGYVHSWDKDRSVYFFANISSEFFD